MSKTFLYQRILLKLSGEALSASPVINTNPSVFPIDLKKIDSIVDNIAYLIQHQVEVGIVIGGGNWIRGVNARPLGLHRITSDHLGMLATVMNAFVVRDQLIQKNIPTKVMSAIALEGLAETFEITRAKDYLSSGKVVIFAGGTGNPLVSTDSAASLRALEMEADILLKATSVDGIYSEDPRKNSHATLYQQLSYRSALSKELQVMDLSAFIQCRDHQLPIRVFNLNTPQNLLKIMQSKSIGTLVCTDVEDLFY